MKKEECSAGMMSRYDMSDFTFRRLQKDYINFTEKYSPDFKYDYITRILINYMDYAKENNRDEFENKVINRLLNESKNDYNYESRITINSGLADKMDEFDFIYNDNFKKRPVITYILELFSALRLSDREKVFCYQQYKDIKSAIKNQYIIFVTTSSDKVLEIKPIDLDVDDNSGSYYLIGYSRLKGSNDKYGCHSLKLSRIKKCSNKHQESDLTSKEKNTASAILEKFGIAYMQHNLTKYEIEKTVVRLTKRGYQHLYLRIISHQRPFPISEPVEVSINGKTFYKLTFDCSYNQIRNYFFSFGADAEIISPPSLRKWFINDYQNALKTYNAGNE